MKLTRVTPAGLEVFGEVPTAFEFLVSEPPSQKNSNGNFKLYIKIWNFDDLWRNLVNFGEIC